MIKDEIEAQIRKGLLYTLLISVMGAFLLMQIVFSHTAQSFEGGQAVTLLSIAGGCWAMLLTVLSLPAFFNLFNWVRNNRIYRFLSFYLLPVVATVSIIFVQKDTNEFLAPIVVMTIPFLVTHTFFFIKFIKVAIDATDNTTDDQAPTVN